MEIIAESQSLNLMGWPSGWVTLTPTPFGEKWHASLPIAHMALWHGGDLKQAIPRTKSTDVPPNLKRGSRSSDRGAQLMYVRVGAGTACRAPRRQLFPEGRSALAHEGCFQSGQTGQMMHQDPAAAYLARGQIHPFSLYSSTSSRLYRRPQAAGGPIVARNAPPETVFARLAHAPLA